MSFGAALDRAGHPNLPAPATREHPPPGRRVRLPRRGRIFFREVKGPPRAPTVVLVHGWIASGGLNWLPVFRPLGRHFRVLAPDLRGHGRGRRGLRRFRLADCADDIAALLRFLDAGPAIVAGYSLGGPVAQLLWRRHPEEVAGLVLCATSAYPVREQRAGKAMHHMMSTAAVVSRLVGWSTFGPRAISRALRAPRERPQTLAAWKRAEMGRHHWSSLLEAGSELGLFDARPWIGEVDVPTTVLVTTRDRVMPPEEQRDLADRIPGARVRRFDDGHLACIRPEFGDAVLDACQDVARRAISTSSSRARCRNAD